MFWVIWILLGICFLGLVYVSPYGLRILQVRRLRTLCRKQRALVLTYDDGPGINTTPRLLDLLASHGAKATFFLVGRSIEVSPSTVHRMQLEGHDLASHSQSHLNAWKVAPWRSVADVRQGFQTLRKHKINFGLFRPPYGKITLFTCIVTLAARLRFGWWTVVSGDTFAKFPDPGQIVKTVENEGGAVVLMHDFDRDEERTGYVLDLTKRLLELAAARGWKICTQSELQKWK